MNQAIDFYPPKQQYLCDSMKKKKADCSWKIDHKVMENDYGREKYFFICSAPF